VKRPRKTKGLAKLQKKNHFLFSHFRLLENTREIIHLTQQSRDHINVQHNRIENDAINEAIFSYGLKKSVFSDDDEDSTDNHDSDMQPSSSSTTTSSTPSTSNSSNSSSSSLVDFAINSAIQSYGLQKKNGGDGGGGGDRGGT
jgi:hypothetical protein